LLNAILLLKKIFRYTKRAAYVKKAQRHLIEGRNDVFIYCKRSCIYGIGAPMNTPARILFLKKGQTIERKKLLRDLMNLLRAQRCLIFPAHLPRARRCLFEIIPAYQYEEAVRFLNFGATK
jgi:excinuclease ABC subunit B